MKTQNFKKDIDCRLFCGLIIVMALLLTTIVYNACGIGPPSCSDPCKKWGFDGSNWGCIDKCGYPQSCCNGTCYNEADCNYCDGVTPQSTCDPNKCETCDGNGNCPVCGGVNPDMLCCNGECYDRTTQRCCVDTGNNICDIDKECCNGSCCNTKDCPTCPPAGLPITLYVNPIESTPGSQCGSCSETGGECGAVGPPMVTGVTIPMPCFASCKWKFGVSATADYCYGACFSMCLNIEGASSPYLNPSNCAAIANGFVYGNGCVSYGGSRYSNYFCLEFHEAYHLGEYIGYVEEGAVDLQEDPAFSDMDCPDGASSCEAAKSAREASIKDAVHSVYENAEGGCNEAGAVAAAQWCFYAIALDICEGNCDCGW